MPDNTFEKIAKDVVRTESEERLDLQAKENLSGIYVFISIDLVNSTIFKTRYTQYWPLVIRSFYNIVTSALGVEEAYRSKEAIGYIGTKEKFDSEKMKTKGFKVWKLVGDEVLLCHKIVSVSEVLNTVRIMHYITCNIMKLFVKKGKDFFKDDSKSFEEFSRIAQRHLSAKTTIWCAKCGEEITLDCPNMLYDSSNYMDSEGTYLDFLGPDIDAGFRLCRYAEKNKVIISPNLVSLLSTQMEKKEETELCGEIRSCFRIVSYVELEDVWEKRLYPVFLYCPQENGNMNNNNWKELFEYDEVKTSKLSKYIFEVDDFYNSKEYSYEKLDRIYRDLGRADEINSLKETFRNQTEQLLQVKNIIERPEHRFEFHIACACYNKEKKKIWIERHPVHGLSFGCIRIDMNHNYKEKVRQFYREKHRINICFEEELRFLSLYSVSRKNRKEEILGIIFLVDAEPISGVTAKQENGWYSFSGLQRLIRNDHKRINEFEDVIGKIQTMVS